MTSHPRTAWTTRQPTRTRPFTPTRVKGVVIHYAGFNVAPLPPFAGTLTAALLRSIQKGHMDRHGWWDIAYHVAVDQTGDQWTLRDLDVRGGANGTNRANRRYVTVVALLGPDQEPSEPMLDGLRAAIAAIRVRYPDATSIIPHSAIKPTACPGDRLRHAIDIGLLEPADIAAPTPVFALRAGATGPTVARIQGAVGGLTVDGIYGPRTTQRVVDIQAACLAQLGPANGVADTRFWSWVLWAERSERTEPAPILR